MTLVFLDTETTHLDPEVGQIWEIAYAVDDGEIQSRIVEHTWDKADPKALEIGNYWSRVTGAMMGAPAAAWEFDLQEELEGATLVGANPHFDASFLAARWGRTPWKYRLLDVEAYAMGAFGLLEPKGLAYIAEQLGVIAPDHTAAGDVATLRECYGRLKSHYHYWRNE